VVFFEVSSFVKTLKAESTLENADCQFVFRELLDLKLRQSLKAKAGRGGLFTKGKPETSILLLSDV